MHKSYNLTYLHDIKSLLTYLINITNIYNTNESFLLNKNNKSIFCLLEKVIYDLSLFIINEQFDNFDIEFWFKNQASNQFHFDCDEYDSKINLNKNSKIPFQTIILYLNNNDEPTIITNINKTDIDNNDKIISVSYPKELKMICFDGGNLLHGVCGKNFNANRNLIIINIWKKYKPLYVQYFNYESLIYKYSLHYNTKIPNINFVSNNSLFTFNKCDLLELSDNNLVDTLYNEIVTTNTCNYNINIIKNNNNHSDYLLTTSSNILALKCFSISGFLKQNICEWIIHEANKHASIAGWHTDRHLNYPTTDIPLESIKSVFNMFSYYFHSINTIIKNNYQINKNINIYDCFVVKYEHNKQNKLDLHIDECDITINILLSKDTDFDGGGTYFKYNNLTVKLKQGDILIHNGSLEHAACQITSGNRYVLVAFINFVNTH